ncbi:MAG: sugar phosphate isomerase/epimerase [Anaerolineaceae bacterium]|nr:sugar phosphate isomerase/epimerase [Anaerolineaceae bacterium]
MRFGIMAMQLGMLIPSFGSTVEDARSVLGSYDFCADIRKLHDAGFSLIELNPDLSLFLPSSYTHASIEKLAALKQELGLQFTLHLPLWSVEPSTPLDPVRQGSTQALIEAIHLTRELEPEVYVLHATGALAAEFSNMPLPAIAHEYVLGSFMRGARHSIQHLLAETGIAPRKLALETIEFPFEMTLEMAQTLDVSMCLDVGHVLSGFSGPISLNEALGLCMPYLAEVHLHDSPKLPRNAPKVYGKDHQALGKGDLDVDDFLTRLREADFRGPVIFELSVPEALESMALVRQVCPECLDVE